MQEILVVGDVVHTAQRVLVRPMPAVYGARRPGGPPILVADAQRAPTELVWTPRYPELESIIRHAPTWESLNGAPITEPASRCMRQTATSAK